ncbi:putative membrane protein At1g16860 [Bidens hawaiensis]|uniref:putative membrane protein At1g16860 n=1 Tax=Bidens hawaiensis TaxID=980011 RepID=UPI00404AA45D
MSSRFPSHQLNNGLYVSGRPEQPKERAPTMSSTAVPYTGGDIKKSGELGKMFDVDNTGSRPRKSGPIANAPLRTGSFGGGGSSGAGAGSSSTKKTSSGPLNKHGEPIRKSSGPQGGSRHNSGPIPPVLPTTGLITSGPLNSAGAPRRGSGPNDGAGSGKPQPTMAKNPAVTYLRQGDDGLGFSLGGCWGGSSMADYIDAYPDAELRTAKNGQFVKVSGVVTCGNVPLESSFQRVPRCVYTSTRLYEYRGWGSKPANPTHRRFTWGLRSMERQVADFYISDFQSGLRALVKTGYGVRVTPYVDESTIIEVDQSNIDSSPQFIRWLSERNITSDDRPMRLKEGYIKEGSTVSVMGVVQRLNNVLMIVPPSEPVPTECQWARCLLPSSLEGIVLRGEDTSNLDVIPV